MDEPEGAATGVSRPTLSVLMSNYNHARFLPDALQSILDQSYRPKEIILIDDGSTDNSVEVIERFVDHCPSLHFIRNERNMGVLHNIKVLVGMATGDYLFGLACDDMVLPGFLEKSMAMLARHPSAGVCSSLSRVMDEDGRDQGVLPALMVSRKPAYLAPARARCLLGSFGNWMQGNTTVYRKEALIGVGGFRPELHSFTDNFASQVLALKHGACFIPEPLCSWRRMMTTYSARCMTDPETVRQIVRNACDLMRDEYRDIFPRGYARRWKREAVFDQARIALEIHGAAGRRAGLARRFRDGLATLYLLARHRPVISIRRKLRMSLLGSSHRLA